MRRSLFLALVTVALASLSIPERAPAQEAPKVINIVVIDVAGDVQKFLEFPKRAQAIAKQYNSPGQTRVWLSTLAGPNTGSVAVVAEYPSLTAMAEYQAKVGPSPEWQKFIADFNAAGHSVTSSSVAVEQAF